MSHRWIVSDPPPDHAAGHLPTWAVGLQTAATVVATLGDDLFRAGGSDDDPRLDATGLAASSGRHVTADEIALALAASGWSWVDRPDGPADAETMARGDVRCWLQYAAWYGGFVCV